MYLFRLILCVLLLSSPWQSLLAITIFENRDIPLIDNRFRIDHGVDKATFLLYREKGSPASILVRPDGSKLYSWQLPSTVQWLETDELDIVTIEKPMPGPWQAVAENRGRNRIRVLSDVVLDVDPIPRKAFEGELIKLQTRLTNRGEKLDLKVYLAEALLDVSLQDAHLTEEELVDYEPTKLGVFLDNGQEWDEAPGDGVFTTLLTLEVPAGQYNLIIQTINEVFTRAFQKQILIFPPPYIALLMPPEDENDNAELVVTADTDEILSSSMIVEGTVQDNFGWREPFQIHMGEQEEIRYQLPMVTKPGRYKVEANIFATTIEGREIVLSMAEKSFIVLEPPPPPPPPVVEPEPEPTPLWVWILVGIGGVLLLAGLVFLFIWWRKRRAFAKALASAIPEKSDKKEEPKPQIDEMPMEEPDLTLPEDEQ